VVELQSVTEVSEPKRLDGASMRDPSLNLPQGREIDTRLRLNQPHSQAPPERRGSDEGDMMGKAKNGGRKNYFAPSQGGEE
jgi:hypothetical protein